MLVFPPLRGENSLTMSVAGTRPACAMEAQSNSNVDGRKEGKREEEGRRKREGAPAEKLSYSPM